MSDQSNNHSLDISKPHVAPPSGAKGGAAHSSTDSSTVESSSSSPSSTSRAVRTSSGIAAFFSRAWQIDAAAVALLAVLTGGAYVVAVAPTLERREANEQRRQALIEAKSRVASLATQSRITRTQLANAQNELASVEIPLQRASTVNARMAAMTDLAAHCGLDVQFTQTSTPTFAASQRFGRVSIQMSGGGSYGALSTFLQRLRKDFPDTGVRALDLSVPPGDSAAVISFNFNLVWYVQGK